MDKGKYLPVAAFGAVCFFEPPDCSSTDRPVSSLFAVHRQCTWNPPNPVQATDGPSIATT